MPGIEDEVLGLLSRGGPWTGRRLALELGCSLRTVRRALATLEAQGVPLETEVGRGGGVRLAAGAGLQRLKLDQREVVDLLLALAVAESMGSPLLLKSVRSVRRRLGAAFPPQRRKAIARLRTRILVGAAASVPVASTWRPVSSRVVAPLQDAFFARVVARLEYVDLEGRRTQRTVEPQALLLNPPVWYVLCWDRERQGGRSLRLDRIESVTPTAEGFVDREPATLLDDLARFFRSL